MSGPRATEQHDIESRMAAIGVLAGGVAHEINNPLAYAMGNLSFAIEHLQTAESTPELEMVLLALRDAQEGAERVRRTVRVLKTFSRPHSDSKGPVDLERVLSAAVAMAKLQKNLRLSADIGTLPHVTGIEAGLAQVFLTLLLRSAPGTEAAPGDESEVRLSARQTSPDEIVVEIASGGAVAADAAHTFGFEFCKRTLEPNGGTISTTGSPPTIQVALPVARDTTSARRPSGPTRSSRRRASVLVVDDEPPMATAIARVLGPSHDVTAVHSGEDALLRLELGEDFDVILCDLVMPGMTGTELYRRLETKGSPFIHRIVFMTAGPFSVRGDRVLDSLDNLRVEKPFSPETLRAAVDQVVAAVDVQAPPP